MLSERLLAGLRGGLDDVLKGTSGVVLQATGRSVDGRGAYFLFKREGEFFADTFWLWPVEGLPLVELWVSLAGRPYQEHCRFEDATDLAFYMGRLLTREWGR